MIKDSQDDYPKASCQFCTTSQPLAHQTGPKTVVTFPCFACLNENSTHYGVWMTPQGSCDEYLLDFKRHEAIEKAKSRIIQPSGKVRKRLLRN